MGGGSDRGVERGQFRSHGACQMVRVRPRDGRAVARFVGTEGESDQGFKGRRGH